MYSRTTTTFEKVSIKAVYRWKENGKPRQRTKEFWQTLSPFNRNKEGFLKNRREIWDELYVERDKWLLKMKQEFRSTEATPEIVKPNTRPIKVVKQNAEVIE